MSVLLAVVALVSATRLVNAEITSRITLEASDSVANMPVPCTLAVCFNTQKHSFALHPNAPCSTGYCECSIGMQCNVTADGISVDNQLCILNSTAALRKCPRGSVVNGSSEGKAVSCIDAGFMSACTSTTAKPVPTNNQGTTGKPGQLAAENLVARPTVTISTTAQPTKASPLSTAAAANATRPSSEATDNGTSSSSSSRATIVPSASFAPTALPLIPSATPTGSTTRKPFTASPVTTILSTKATTPAPICAQPFRFHCKDELPPPGVVYADCQVYPDIFASPMDTCRQMKNYTYNVETWNLDYESGSYGGCCARKIWTQNPLCDG